MYVMMPLLPAFEGEFGTVTGVAIQAITHWNFASICRGGNSLIEKLSRSEGKLEAVRICVAEPLMKDTPVLGPRSLAVAEPATREGGCYVLGFVPAL